MLHSLIARLKIVLFRYFFFVFVLIYYYFLISMLIIGEKAATHVLETH